MALGLLVVLELGGPRVAESKGGTPWHPHHIAERYGLLVIITLGEVILGAVASVEAVVNGEAGWSLDAALLLVAGVGLAFGCWWMYFAVPWAEPLVRHRERAWVFGYGHLFGYAALAAMGAGLHVAAIALEGKAEIGDGGDRPQHGAPVRDLHGGLLRALLAAHPRRAIRSTWACWRAPPSWSACRSGWPPRARAWRSRCWCWRWPRRSPSWATRRSATGT